MVARKGPVVSRRRRPGGSPAAAVLRFDNSDVGSRSGRDADRRGRDWGREEAGYAHTG